MRPDDPTILDEVQLFRLVTREHYSGSPDDGSLHLESGLFDNSSDGDRDEMSIVLGDTLAAASRSAVELGRPGVGVVMITAGFARQEGQTVARDPDEHEPAHGVVCGTKNTKRRRRFRNAAVWIVLPAGE